MMEAAAFYFTAATLFSGALLVAAMWVFEARQAKPRKVRK